MNREQDPGKETAEIWEGHGQADSCPWNIGGNEWARIWSPEKGSINAELSVRGEDYLRDMFIRRKDRSLRTFGNGNTFKAQDYPEGTIIRYNEESLILSHSDPPPGPSYRDRDFWGVVLNYEDEGVLKKGLLVYPDIDIRSADVGTVLGTPTNPNIEVGKVIHERTDNSEVTADVLSKINRVDLYNEGSLLLDPFKPQELPSLLWQALIVEGTNQDGNDLAGSIQNPLPDELNFLMPEGNTYALPDNTYVNRTLRGFFNLQIAAQTAHIRKPLIEYEDLRSRALLDVAGEIRRRNQYYLFPRLLEQIKKTDLEEEQKFLLFFDIASVYLLACMPNRFLTGIRDGLHWKSPSWPEKEITHKTTRDLAEDYALFYLPKLELIGREEEIVIPENPLPSKETRDLFVPSPARDIQDLLEDAYYHQRYIVPRQGAEVRIRNAGDIDRLIITQRRDLVFGRFSTRKGDELIVLNLDGGNADAFRYTKNDEAGQNLRQFDGLLGNVLAEVYHDIVTAIELPRNRTKTMNRSSIMRNSTGGEIDLEENPQVIFIPRIIRVGREPEVRVPYDGLTRPVIPHRVSGHLRHANMTEAHREELLKFEVENDISILKHVPTGWTFVRPYSVPAGEELSLRHLPTFIKRRIETRFAQGIQEQLREEAIRNLQNRQPQNETNL